MIDYYKKKNVLKKLALVLIFAHLFSFSGFTTEKPDADQVLPLKKLKTQLSSIAEQKQEEPAPSSKEESSNYHEEYKKYWHSHIDEQNHDGQLYTLYISEAAKLQFCIDGKPIEHALIAKRDKSLRRATQVESEDKKCNRLFVRFEVGYLDNKVLNWKSFSLYSQKEPDGEKYKIKVLEEEESNSSNNKECLADFTNKSFEEEMTSINGYHLREVAIDIDTLEKTADKLKITFTKNTENGYHSEGHAITYLYHNSEIFKNVIERVTNGNPVRTIETFIIKFYSAYDICTDCQKVMLKSQPILKDIFKKHYQAKNNPAFLMIGIGYDLYYENYWRYVEEKSIDNNKSCSNGPPNIISFKNEENSNFCYNGMLSINQFKDEQPYLLVYLTKNL